MLRNSVHWERKKLVNFYVRFASAINCRQHFQFVKWPKILFRIPKLTKIKKMKRKIWSSCTLVSESLVPLTQLNAECAIEINVFRYFLSFLLLSPPSTSSPRIDWNLPFRAQSQCHAAHCVPFHFIYWLPPLGCRAHTGTRGTPLHSSTAWRQQVLLSLRIVRVA